MLVRKESKILRTEGSLLAEFEEFANDLDHLLEDYIPLFENSSTTHSYYKYFAKHSREVLEMIEDLLANCEGIDNEDLVLYDPNMSSIRHICDDMKDEIDRIIYRIDYANPEDEEDDWMKPFSKARAMVPLLEKISVHCWRV